VGSRLTSFCLIAALAFAAPAAHAETKKPTPKATAKVTAKATAKPSVKASAKATSKTSAKPTAKATAKPTAKATAKASSTSTTKATSKPKATKKPVVKKKKKKKAKVRVTPSPKPAWPPKGFSVEGEVYAKVPTAKELVSIISANSYLEKQIKKCSTNVCAAVQVTAEAGCIWWETFATVTDSQGAVLGEMMNSYSGTTAREFKTLLMITPELVETGGVAKVTSVICHHEDRDSNQPGSTYKKS
jgi:cytoskeletal protein RodZ